VEAVEASAAVLVVLVAPVVDVVASVAVVPVAAVVALVARADSKKEKRLRNYSEAFSVVSSSASLKSVMSASMRMLYQEMSFLMWLFCTRS